MDSFYTNVKCVIWDLPSSFDPDKRAKFVKFKKAVYSFRPFLMGGFLEYIFLPKSGCN